MTSPTPEVLRLIESEYRRAEEARTRLGNELMRAESEWRHWRALMSLHGRLKATNGEARAAPILVKADIMPRVTLVRNAAGKTGVTQVILDAVKAHPGLEQKALLDLLQERSTSDSPAHRKNLRNMVKYLKSTNRLVMRDERYYLAEK